MKNYSILGFLLLICSVGEAQDILLSRTEIDTLPRIGIELKNGDYYKNYNTAEESITIKYSKEGVEINRASFSPWVRRWVLSNGSIIADDDYEMSHAGWFFYSSNFKPTKHFCHYKWFEKGLLSFDSNSVSFASQRKFRKDSICNVTRTDLEGKVLFSRDFKLNEYHISKIHAINDMSYLILESSQLTKMISLNFELNVVYEKVFDNYVSNNFIYFSKPLNSLFLVTRDELISVNLSDGNQNWIYQRKDYNLINGVSYWSKPILNDSYFAFITREYFSNEQLPDSKREKHNIKLMLLELETGQLVFSDDLDNTTSPYNVINYDEQSFYVSNYNDPHLEYKLIKKEN